MAFNFLVNFWRTVDESRSMTCTILEDSISILYYFNDENTNLEKIFELLNSFGETYNLQQRGWNLPFRMRVSDSEMRNRDYFKRI